MVAALDDFRQSFRGIPATEPLPRVSLHFAMHPPPLSGVSTQNVIIQTQSGDSRRGAVSSLRPFCTVGEWLSLVEHLVRDQGVGGSNPLSPTNLFKRLNCTSGFPSTLNGVENVDGASTLAEPIMPS